MSLLDLPFSRHLGPALETALNKALSMDPKGHSKVEVFKDCIVEINITSLNHSFFIGVDNGQVKLIAPEGPPTITVSGSSIGLLKLALVDHKEGVLKSREVSITGDAVRGQQLQYFLNSIEVDWEGLLADLVGDAAAKLIFTNIKHSYLWGKALSSSFMRDLEDFIKFELKSLPSKAMSKAQFEKIDQLRLASDRLEAKFKNVIRKKENH